MTTDYNVVKGRSSATASVVWKGLAVFFAIVSLCLLAALIAVIVTNDKQLDEMRRTTFPCPPGQDGVVASSGDPESPGPFHDMTAAEYKRVQDFLMTRTELKLVPTQEAWVNSSHVFLADLHLPPKQQVLSFLDSQGPQPAREARVMIFRGDQKPPVVEEYRVGPLNNPRYMELLDNPQRKNPVPFAFRPISTVEFNAVYFAIFMFRVDAIVGEILRESYGGTFTNCGDTCIHYYPSYVGSALTGDNTTRRLWFWGNYPAEYKTVHPVDFGVRALMPEPDPTTWGVDKVWYAGTLYDSLQDLKNRYHNESAAINKTRVEFVHNSKTLKSTQNLRGDPVPPNPQRPPVQIEPDGKRYSIQHRHVSYLHWDFDIRLSALTGPQVYDIRFHGDRIAYELGLAEIAVFYSGDSPMQRVTDLVDSGGLIGISTQTLVPGSDCPESASYLSASFLGEAMEKVARATCVFEHNMGVPLRRHMSYTRAKGNFYGGMADSALIVRSIISIGNYDYIVDFVFHQNGAIETRAIATGHILATFYRPEEAPYGFRLDDHISGNLHHHMFHFKADLDIGGISNRYETLDFTEEEVLVNQVSPPVPYSQTRFDRHLRQTENDAVYKFHFDAPKYHIVHNEQKKTEYGAPRAYRIQMDGMSKQLLTPDQNNERTIPWARQQLAVTVHKDHELVSSSPYAMFDSLDPVTNFTNFINDESIVDQDLVFWVTLGTHHLPHTEDLPVTPTVGGHLSFFLLPYNYFPECPSVSSRDGIRVDYVTETNPADGLRVERNGNQASGECGAATLEQLVRERPDDFLQTTG